MQPFNQDMFGWFELSDDAVLSEMLWIDRKCKKQKSFFITDVFHDFHTDNLLYISQTCLGCFECCPVTCMSADRYDFTPWCKDSLLLYITFISAAMEFTLD